MEYLHNYIFSLASFSQDMPIEANITTLDLVMSLFLGVCLISVLTLSLDHWSKAQIKEMEEESRLFIDRLLK